MDPNVCYRELLQALVQRDWDTARERAAALRNWLGSGGFPPDGFSRADVQTTLKVVADQALTSADVPFTLICAECDAGEHIESEEQALREGWTNVTFAPDLPMANYVGLCPECREAQERPHAAEI